MAKKLFYFMHVDWDWAKQRPHFLALKLAKLYKVIVFYPYSWKRSNLRQNPREGLILIPLFMVPFRGRFACLERLNKQIFKIFFRILFALFKPDILWLTSSQMYEYFPNNSAKELIYDCMDDVVAFPVNISKRSSLCNLEAELISRCTHIFTSSHNLRDILLRRTLTKKKIHVVPNAYEPSASSYRIGEPINNSTKSLTLGYIGTISSWFDFEGLKFIVDSNPAIKVLVLGPIENLAFDFPKQNQIQFLGPVSHSELYKYIPQMDVFIMPFNVTELVKSVDPVKFYEYILFNKPIISVWYEGLRRFESFVDFYNTKEELLRIANSYLESGPQRKFSELDRIKFLAENTWDCRVLDIVRLLN